MDQAAIAEAIKAFFGVIGIFASMLWADKQLNRLRDYLHAVIERRRNEARSRPDA